MFPLNNTKQERFAAALARGLSPRDAGREARYKNLKNCAAIAGHKLTAELKGKLPEQRFFHPDRVAPDDDREISRAEWMRRFGRPAPMPSSEQ